MIDGRFVAFEGGEGSGKSTQAARLGRAISAVVTREPGGTHLGGLVRALLLDPTLLMLDEPTQGLAPIMVRQVLAALQSLRGRFAILVVEQNQAFLTHLADRMLRMHGGRLEPIERGVTP